MELQTATLTVNGNELQIIWQALDELPGKVSRPLFVKLQEQVKQQIEEHERASK